MVDIPEYTLGPSSRIHESLVSEIVVVVPREFGVKVKVLKVGISSSFGIACTLYPRVNSQE